MALFFIFLIIILLNLLKISLENNKLKDEIKEQKNNISSLSNNNIKVEIIYNKSTGELYPVFTDAMNPHTCVWTVWGDHGSDSIVITRGSDMYNMNSSDYTGHILSNGIKVIEENNFLPPRLPIYVMCVDWNNEVYRGSINEFKF